MHWQFYKNIYNEVLFFNTNWKHHPCPCPTASYIILSILQYGYQRSLFTLICNSSTHFSVETFHPSNMSIPNVSTGFRITSTVLHNVHSSFTMSEFSCQYADTAQYTTEFYPQNNFFPIHLQIVEVFMGK